MQSGDGIIQLSKEVVVRRKEIPEIKKPGSDEKPICSICEIKKIAKDTEVKETLHHGLWHSAAHPLQKGAPNDIPL